MLKQKDIKYFICKRRFLLSDPYKPNISYLYTSGLKYPGYYYGTVKNDTLTLAGTKHIYTVEWLLCHHHCF